MTAADDLLRRIETEPELADLLMWRGGDDVLRRRGRGAGGAAKNRWASGDAVAGHEGPVRVGAVPLLRVPDHRHDAHRVAASVTPQRLRRRHVETTAAAGGRRADDDESVPVGSEANSVPE